MKESTDDCIKKRDCGGNIHFRFYRPTIPSINAIAAKTFFRIGR